MPAAPDLAPYQQPTLEVVRTGETIEITVRGHVDDAVASELDRVCQTLREHAPRHVEVDLSAVTGCDPEGDTALRDCVEVARGLKNNTVIVVASAAGRQALLSSMAAFERPAGE